MKADIARYEVIYTHGGVYLDTDFKCLRNIEPLLEGADFFSAWEDDERVANSLFGAMPGRQRVRRRRPRRPRHRAAA
jgi:mannosyltransferase OCH1-like enzyme